MLTFDSVGGVLPVDDVLSKIKGRHLNRISGDFAVANASDLHLEYDNLNKNYWARFNGETFGITANAYKGACGLIGASPSYFGGFRDPDEFIRQFSKRIDSGKGSEKKSIKMILRTSEGPKHRKIDAVLPPNYKILDDYEVIVPVLERMEANGQKVHGITVGKTIIGETDYQVLYGEVIADSKQLNVNGDNLHSVVHIHNDELGPECGFSLGNWRKICSNVTLAGSWKGRGVATLPSSMQVPGIKWNHTSDTNNFFSRASKLLQGSDQYNDRLRNRFPVSASTKIEVDPARLVEYLSGHNFIPKQAKNSIIDQMRSENVENEWEWINVNTFVAQRFEPRVKRAVESLAHAVLINGFGKLIDFIEGGCKENKELV
jgi:hypothetical protein